MPGRDRLFFKHTHIVYKRLSPARCMRMAARLPAVAAVARRVQRAVGEPERSNVRLAEAEALALGRRTRGGALFSVAAPEGGGSSPPKGGLFSVAASEGGGSSPPKGGALFSVAASELSEGGGSLRIPASERPRSRRARAQPCARGTRGQGDRGALSHRVRRSGCGGAAARRCKGAPRARRIERSAGGRLLTVHVAVSLPAAAGTDSESHCSSSLSSVAACGGAPRGRRAHAGVRGRRRPRDCFPQREAVLHRCGTRRSTLERRRATLNLGDWSAPACSVPVGCARGCGRGEPRLF